ncbi:MAG: peptide chain release factor N(5)-glutamine methyltransferase [Elusimicrobia bacterium]|nr:peptide chain release factor N(5)-glutamine methyltransferase [Elusimicrobiota bacterium]
MENIWTVGKILSWTEKYFENKNIPDSRLETEILLSSIMGCRRLDLVLRKDDILKKEALKSFKILILERQKRKPLSYLLGEHEFMGLKILVDENTLIPRPETEILVEESLKILEREKGKVAADICTGSGCIAACLAKFSSAEIIYATDLSSKALEIAYKNILKNNVVGKVILKNGDLFNAFQGENIENKLDMIISNPPYVAENELAALQPEISYEPKMALNGGKDGLDFYRRISSEAHFYLKPGGYLIMEMNSAKSAEINKIFETNGVKVEKTVKDFSSLERVIIGKING